jgi:hypothetical protein
MVPKMGSYYLAADERGWHRPVHRAELSFDCAHAVTEGQKIERVSVLDSAQRTALVAQWTSNGGSLSDEWIPSEWLLRVWDSPAMAATENSTAGLQTRLFGIDAEPVALDRSIPVVIPELGLAGVDKFRVTEELPAWWMLGPCGREVQALLTQALTVESEPGSATVKPVWADLSRRALEVVDDSLRVGAYAIVQEALDSPAVAGHRELALRAALGFMLKDVWFEASLLYDPWIERFGLPDLAAVAGQSDRAYPAPVAP